jgi:hypothetical protein
LTWRDLIASLVDSLAWPAAVVVLVVALRHQLGVLFEAPLQRLKLGPGGVEAEWDRTERATAVAAAGSVTIRSRSDATDIDFVEERLNVIEPLADTVPAVAIRQAFDVVESELRRLVDDAGVELVYPNPDVHGYLKSAYHGDLISKELGEAIRGLIVLRDLTNNDPGGTRTSPEKARDFLVLARSVLYSLSAATRRRGDSPPPPHGSR